MTDHPKRRRMDKWAPLLIVIAVVVLLVTAVFSTVSLLSIDKAENAASDAKEAAADSARALKAATENSATIDDLCQVARRQRLTLTTNVRDIKAYLDSPAAREQPGFTAYIKNVSLPQAISRAKTEKVPENCRRQR